ncbi:Hpt domain-containing protein [Allocoleopsis sp.]|uniref:hybrid sensor histidine kinase/response regulator n=1 Tax=Allocoleopsis sp. TaxID=3088169 RepID=UPI002FCF8240
MIEDEELRNLYQISSEEHLQQLEAGLRYLTSHPDDEATLKELRREAHGLRGDSRGVGAEAVETLAHWVEKILGKMIRQQVILTPLLCDRLYQGLAVMSLLVQEAVTAQTSGVNITEVMELLTVDISESQQLQPEVSKDSQTEQTVELALPALVDNGEQLAVSSAIAKRGCDSEMVASLPFGTLPSGTQRERASAQTAEINKHGLQSAPTLTEDETLRTLYHSTSLERLQKLETGLRHLVSYPDDETTLEELQREAHSLTGDSKSAGVETVEILARSLEDILLSIKQQQIVLTQQVSTRLNQGLAAINHLVQEAVTGQPSGVDVAEVFELWMEVVLESQQPRQNTTPDAEADKQETKNFPSQPTIENRKERVSIPFFQGKSSKDFTECQAPSSESGGNPKSKIQNPKSIDHTHPFITPTSRVELKGNSPQIPPAFIEDEQLRDLYKVTSEERLQKLEAGLLHLEKHPNNETILEELLREAHSLKGDSRSADLESVESLTHEVEEILLGIKRQQIIFTPEVSDRLYQGLDAIALLIHEAVTGQRIEVDTARVLQQLMEVVAAPTLPESLPISPETPSTKIEAIASKGQRKAIAHSAAPEAIAPQDIPTPAPGAIEPYRIDTIRVPTRELDALMTQAEELTVTKIHIAHATAEIEELASLWDKWKAFAKKQRRSSPSVATNPYQESIEKAIDALTLLTQENTTKLDLIAGELREKIRTLRLLPLSTLFQLFPRVVRDLARQQGKEVELIIEAGETTADKRILEEIKDSLMHIIRNAIDHGIETPAEREKLGKPPVATIWLRGYRKANNIVIEIADDGRGLDIERIQKTAIKRKLYQQEDLETMTPNQIYSLIFSPGFSTRTFITEISGRGIGLDVVRTHVERLKGTIQIESTLGQGCTFRLQLGTSLATIDALLVQVQGIIHALPMEYVPASLLVSQDEISTFEGRASITWENQTIPVADLADVLQLSNSPAYASIAKVEQQTSDLRTCILVKVGEEQAGFFCDRLLDTQEVVLKPQSQLLKRVRNVSGATILPSGEVCMILNPPDLLKSLQMQTASLVFIQPRKTLKTKPIILLVEDSIYVRTQEQRLLEKAGYEVVTAVDGLDGYHQLKEHDFDAVISDVEMPNLDGLSLTAKIRQHQEYKNLPIILVTTLDSDEDRKRGTDAGASAYVIKGKFNQGVLLETLGRLL